MKIYFALWSLILMLPMPIKILLELLIALLLIALIWPIFKYIFWGIFKVFTGLNHLILGGIRNAADILLHNSATIYDLDERIGTRGRKIDDWLNKKGESIRTSKCKIVIRNKWIWVVSIAIYIIAILPCFKLENIVSEYYLDNIYCVNRMFVSMESRLTQGIEEYPDLFKKIEKKPEKKAEEKEPESIYLQLSDEVSYANIREEASIDSSGICVVSQEDKIAYDNIFEYDEERIWLKVTVESQDNAEGWISSKVISKETLDTLDLH